MMKREMLRCEVGWPDKNQPDEGADEVEQRQKNGEQTEVEGSGRQ